MSPVQGSNGVSFRLAEKFSGSSQKAEAFFAGGCRDFPSRSCKDSLEAAAVARIAIAKGDKKNKSGELLAFVLLYPRL